MAQILSIETSEKNCSVAISENEKLLASQEILIDKSHASMLTVLIEELFKKLGKDINSLDAVAISKGPGSYTGLRIGVSVAKGICFGLSIPLIAVNTLEFMRFGLNQVPEFKKFKDQNPSFLICSMIDARRMEVYRALQNEKGELIEPVIAEEVNSSSFINILENNKVIFIGSGADKCINIINHENAIFYQGIRPNAIHMISMAHQYFSNQQFENLAYFEPYYLKDFVATTSKKKIPGLY